MIVKGHEVTFYSKGCKIRKEGFGRLVANEIRSPNNAYVLNEIKINKKSTMGVSLIAH